MKMSLKTNHVYIPLLTKHRVGGEILKSDFKIISIINIQYYFQQTINSPIYYLSQIIKDYYIIVCKYWVISSRNFSKKSHLDVSQTISQIVGILPEVRITPFP